jgi:hypothetical protein
MAANITDRPQFAPNFLPPLDTFREDDIVLDNIRSPPSSTPLKRNLNDEENWYMERDTGSPASPISPSSPRWEVSRRSRGRSSDVGIRNLKSPILASVTVTRSRSISGEDALGDTSPRYGPYRSPQRTRGMDWVPSPDGAGSRYDTRTDY